MSLQTLHLKGFHSPFLFAFFVCFFSHESSVRFTVVGICSHNKEDVNSASGELMPETSRPMQSSKGNLHLVKHDLLMCVWEENKVLLQAMHSPLLWVIVQFGVSLCSGMHSVVRHQIKFSWEHSRIYMSRRNLITIVKNAIALLMGTDRKWVHLGKILKFYQESPIPVQNPDSI